MADTQPEADVYNGPGGWWPGTGYGQTAPAARRLNQYFLGVAGAVPGACWCWPGLVPGVSSLPICASSSSGLSLHCPGLATVLLQLISSAHYLRAVKDNH